MTLEAGIDFVAKGTLIVAAIALGFAAFRFALVVRRWAALSRVYGDIPFSLSSDVSHYAASGALVTLKRISLGCFLIGLIVLTAATALEQASWLGHIGTWAFFSIACLAVHVVSTFEVAMPPSILLLGPSSPEVERELAAINRDLPQYRTVSLLRSNLASLSPGSRWKEFANNFRTRDLYQWRCIAFHLMDVVPAIVMCDDDREPVVEELRRIRRLGYLDRTLLTHRTRLNDPVERQRIRDWLRQRLANVSDQKERQARQHSLVLIRTSVPGHLWYPETIEEFVQKAKALERIAFARFFERCKTISPAEYRGELTEDVPSKTTRAAEREFVRTDRAFEEIDILLRSANETVQETGVYAAFNEANLANKRGWFARFRGEWELAEQEIFSAIAQFEPMTQSGDEDLAGAALREIGTAYYNLGDISLARFRETGDKAFRDQAEERYRLSVQYDQRGNGDTGPASRRLATL